MDNTYNTNNTNNNRQSMEKVLKNKGYEHPSSETQQTSFCPYKVVNTDDHESDFVSTNSYGDMYSSFSQTEHQQPSEALNRRNEYVSQKKNKK